MISMADHLLAYFGHHKCGTGWFTEILLEVSRLSHLQPAYVHNDESCGGHLGRFVADRGVQLLLYVNAEIDQVRTLPLFRGFHVVRDPRDLVVSAYFSHRFSHPLQPWLEEHRARLQGLDDEEGLLAEMQFPVTRMVLDHIRRWDYRQPGVLELRMEEIVRAPEAALSSVFTFLGLGN